jgi:polyhydroxybutyrate depolymerase
MRSSFFVAASVAAALFTVFACSSEGGGSPPRTLPDGAPEGSVILEDGAIVDPDGNIIDPQDSKPPSKVNTTKETIDVDGTPRTYLLSIPKTYNASKKYPLVMALHGDGQDGTSLQSMLAFEDVSGDEAIVAYPDRSEDLYTPFDQNKDQKLVEYAINAIKAKYSVDDGKIWAVGYSKGAFQLNQIACRRPGVFKAMAVHAGGAPEDRQAGNPNAVDCPNAIALPVFVTEGSNDSGIGGQFAALVWSQKAGCGGSTSASTPSICKKYDGCPPATPVSICIVPGQPHYPLYDDAAEHSWAWFKSLP